MTQSNKVKDYLEKFIAEIKKNSSCAPYRDLELHVYLKPTSVEIETSMEVDYINIDIDNFKYSDSEYFKSFCQNKFFKNKLSFELTFEDAPDGYGDYYHPSLHFYDENSYSQSTIKQEIDFTEVEENVMQPESVDFYNSLRININIKTNKKEIYINNLNEIKEYISKSNNYTNVFNEIIGLFDNGSHYFIEYAGVEEFVLNKESLLELVKEDLKTIENSNLFDSFLSPSFNTKTSNYFFFNSDNLSKIISTYVVEHEGYNFHWNFYDRSILPSIKSINLTHSYYDREWKLSNLALSSDLNGYSSTILKENNKQTIEDLVYAYLKDSLKYNPFKKRYTKFCLFLNKDLIESVKILENNSVFGLNQNGEVVFALRYGDGINSSILKDENLLITGINTLISELND